MLCSMKAQMAEVAFHSDRIVSNLRQERLPVNRRRLSPFWVPFQNSFDFTYPSLTGERELVEDRSKSPSISELDRQRYLWPEYTIPISYGFPMASQWFSYGFPMAFLWLSYGFPMYVKYFPSTTCSKIHSHVEGHIRLEIFDRSNIQSPLMVDVGWIECAIPYL